MNINEIDISIGEYHGDNNPKVFKLLTYFDMIRNGNTEVEVGLYREKLQKLGKKGAKTFKDQIKHAYPSAVMDGGSKLQDIKKRTGVICMDVDEDTPEKTLQRLRNDSYILALHKTVSGNGHAIYL